MLGAIFGDIVGSVYEIKNTKREDFPLLSKRSHPTDDSMMTLAVARALMNTWGRSDDEIRAELVRSMQQMGRRYPNAGYGRAFAQWLNENNPRPYNSFGNGSAMRVSSVGWLYHTLEDTLHAAALTAEVSHNHPEGIKGAQVLAACVFLARAGATKEEIYVYAMKTYGDRMLRTLDEIRPKYEFDVSCQGSVPEAIIAFYESESYEDAIRKAVSIGGDSDTIACMAGAIAEAFYGMPGKLKKKALQILDFYGIEIVQQFRQFCNGHDRTIHEGWREEVAPKDPYESLKNNWAIEALLDRIYEKREKGEKDINILPFFSILHYCISEGGEFVVPIEFKPGFPSRLSEIRPGDTYTSGEEPAFVLKHIVDNDDKEALPVFTSESELEKGGPTSRMTLPMEECMHLALDTDYLTGMVINPHGNCFIMDKETLKGFLDLIHSE